jgi:hypothetical protein
MIDRMIDRCRRICKTPDKQCFINSREQLNCIADMVINKAAGISMLLELSLLEEEKDIIDEDIMESISSANELSNWIRYLQMVGDLHELSSLVLDSDSSEKRKEIRYPVPEILSEKISVRVKRSGEIMPVRLTNFSQSGLQIKSPEPLDIDHLGEFSIASADTEARELTLKASIRYCWEQDGKFVMGARIEELLGSATFNFFTNVYDLMLYAAPR